MVGTLPTVQCPHGPSWLKHAGSTGQTGFSTGGPSSGLGNAELILFLPGWQSGLGNAELILFLPGWQAILKADNMKSLYWDTQPG